MATDKSLEHKISNRARSVFKAAVHAIVSSYHAGAGAARAQLLVGRAEAAQFAWVDFSFAGKDHFLVGVQNQEWQIWRWDQRNQESRQPRRARRSGTALGRSECR